MKKITSVLLCIILLALSLTACGSGPDKALDAELALIKEGKFEEVGLLSESAFAEEDTNMLQAMYAKFDYTVGKAVVDGDKAAVEVSITMVDMGAVFSAYMTEAFNHLTETDWDADGSYFAELLRAEDAATKDFSVTVNMALVNDEWVIAEEGNDDLIDAVTGGLMSSLEGLGGLLGE